jgi:hypothetical protein
MQGFGSKTAHFSQKPKNPTQKIQQAFFVSDLGNRAIGQSGNRAIGQSGNYTPLLTNSVNYLTAYILCFLTIFLHFVFFYFRKTYKEEVAE